MLGKLFKYDFKSTGRILGPLYCALLGAALFLGFSVRPMMSDSMRWGSYALTTVGSVLYGFLMAAVIIVTLILVLYSGFYKSLLGSEGYLRFSLPVSTGQQLASKTVNAMVWFLLAGIAVLASFMFFSVPAFSYTELHDGFVSLFNSSLNTAQVRREIAVFSGQILLVMIAGGVSFVLKVFASITIGNEWNAHPIFGAVLVYIGISIVEALISSILPYHMRTINFTNAQTVSAMHAILWGTLAVSAVTAAIFYSIPWYMLDRRLNLQ